MQTLLRGGRVIDPGAGSDWTADVLVRDGTVAAVGPGLAVPDGATVLDVPGLIVGPGFIDLLSSPSVCQLLWGYFTLFPVQGVGVASLQLGECRPVASPVAGE